MPRILYEANFGSDGKPAVFGPGRGMSYNSGTLYPNMRFSTEKDAVAGSLCANEAYQQGYLQAQKGMRQALGLKE